MDRDRERRRAQKVIDRALAWIRGHKGGVTESWRQAWRGHGYLLQVEVVLHPDGTMRDTAQVLESYRERLWWNGHPSEKFPGVGWRLDASTSNAGCSIYMHMEPNLVKAVADD